MSGSASTAGAAVTGPAARQSVGQRPRGVVKINGTTAAFLTFRVENRTHFSADTWTVELEAWNQPQGFGLGFFDKSANTQVEVLIGYLGAKQDVSAIPTSLTSLIIGQVDDIAFELGDGKLVLSGRDFTAKLIDTKTAQKWPDQTASQIVTTLCGMVGLTPNVTATSTPAGQYYNSAYTSVGREVPMWDLVTFLADQEGFDAYVTGQSLYFGPPQADADPSPFTVTIKRDPKTGSIWSSAKAVSVKRSETTAKDITVTVLSHNYQAGKGVKATANRAAVKAASSSASKASESTQNFVIRMPNATLEQAQQKANATLLELTKQEKTADVKGAGNPAVNVRRKVRISGTGTAFDADYYINNVVHACDHKSTGYEMTVALKNHPTLSQATI